MRTIVILPLLLAVAGCTTATPVARSEEGTTIRYDPLKYSAAEIQAQADAICGAYGRHAVLTGVVNEHVLGLGHDNATFDCVD